MLVGNKIDLRGEDVTNTSLEDEVIPIMNEFKVTHYIPFFIYMPSYLFIHHRKWRRASSVLPNNCSMYQKCFTLPKKQCCILPHHFTIQENM